MTVTRISIAPVKSFALVHPDEVELGPSGVVGNSRFWLRDERGALYAGKRDGSMMRIRPEGLWPSAARRRELHDFAGELEEEEPPPAVVAEVAAHAEHRPGE